MIVIFIDNIENFLPFLENRLMDEIFYEIKDVKIETELGTPPAGLAYPYGRYTPSVLQAVQMAGFEWAATARGGQNGRATNCFTLRRTLVKGQDRDSWIFAIKVRTGYTKLVEWRMDLRRIE